MKRPSPTQAAAAEATGCCDEVWGKKYPSIVEHMTCAKWDDGGAREPSSLAITFQGGRAQLALNDKELKQSLYTTAGSVVEALGLLEKALASGVGEWRQWKSGKKR